MNTYIHDRVVLPPGSADELSGCQADSILAASAYKFLHPFQPVTVLLQLLVVHHVAEVLPEVLIHTTVLTPDKSARAAAAAAAAGAAAARVHTTMSMQNSSGSSST
jgi:uncharacterized protein (DUF58 family)